MSILIEVKSPETNVKEGISAKSGKPYRIVEQDAWAHTLDKHGKPQPFPVRIVLSIKDGMSPYATGKYTVDPASFYVDRFNGLALALRLVPAGTSLKAAA